MKEAINNDLWATLTKAEVDLCTAEEHLHEIKSEAGSEAYAFGDAPVGAWDSIARQERQVQYYRNILEALESQMAA